MSEWSGDKGKGDLNPRHQDAMTNAAVTVVQINLDTYSGRPHADRPD